MPLHFGYSGNSDLVDLSVKQAMAEIETRESRVGGYSQQSQAKCVEVPREFHVLPLLFFF